MFTLYCIQHNTNTTITIVLQEQKLIAKWNYFTAFTMTTKNTTAGGGLNLWRAQQDSNLQPTD